MEIYDIAELNKRPIYDYISHITPIKDGIPPIVITNEDIPLHDIIIVNDEAYRIEHILSRLTKERWGIAQKLPDSSAFVSNETRKSEFKKHMTCPYCGFEIKDHTTFKENEDNTICPHCKSMFAYERKIEISYKTKPIARVNVHKF